MAVQFTPLAFLVLRYGAVAVAGYAAARYAPRGRFSPAVTEEMDTAPAGVNVARHDGELSASGKVVKDVKAGRYGPRFRVDGTVLARLRIRRLA